MVQEGLIPKAVNPHKPNRMFSYYAAKNTEEGDYLQLISETQWGITSVQCCPATLSMSLHFFPGDGADSLARSPGTENDWL